MTDAYEFPGLPLEPLGVGSTVLLSGPAHGGTRRLALRLLSPGEDEGTLLVTTNARAERMVARCRRVGMDPSSERTAIIDCVGDDEDVADVRCVTVSGPGDLTGIGMRFTKCYRDLYYEGVRRVRAGVSSLSTLLSFKPLKTVARFVHAIAGRIDSADGVGVLLVDPRVHDERTVSTLAQFCDGTIEVAERDADPHLRTRGLDDQPRGWHRFHPEPR